MFSSPSSRPQRLATPARYTQTPAKSRLQTLRANHSPTPSIADTARTERVSDEKDKLILSRDDRHLVTALGKLPKEVTALVKQSDFVIDPIASHVDSKSGFATVSTSRTCISWNYTKRTHSTPTTYTFPAPVPTSSPNRYPPPVLSAIYTSTSEPGMVLASGTGEVRFWESMSLALSNVERYQQIFIELPEDDWIDRLLKIDGHNFVLTTTLSQAYRLTITSSAGRLLPVLTQLQRPGGIFGRLSPVLFGAKNERQGIKNICSVDGSIVYLLGQKSMLKFIFNKDGQKFVQEYDLYDTIGPAMFEDWSSGEVSLSLKDIAPLSEPDSLIALISYYTSSSKISYALVHFALGRDVQIINSTPISHLPPTDNTFDLPRLLLPPGSPLVFIRAASTVVMVGLDFETPYEEVLTLKDQRSIFLGGGVVDGKGVVFIPSEGGLMGVETLDIQSSSDSFSRLSPATGKLKTRLEQAIFFARSDNPLSFDLTGNEESTDINVSEAAELVSAEVLSSRSPFAPSITAVRPHLSDRLSRLMSLIKYLRENNLLNQVGQASRRRLSRDAEKVRGGLELWDYQDRSMDQMASQPQKSLLTTSIQTYFSSTLHSHSFSPDTDYVRTFFKTEVANLDKLLESVFRIFRGQVDELESEGRRSESAGWVGEVNQIFIAIERAAAQYREEAADLYSIDREKPTIEMWTASDLLLNALEYLYSTTDLLIKERTRDLGSVVDEAPAQQGLGQAGREELRKEQVLQAMLKRQMGWLAAALCTNMEDKCRVSVRRQMDDGSNEEEAILLKTRWDAMKPRVIRPLVAIDRLSEAFELAEHHRDFPTLVVLCQDPVASQGKGEVRVQEYVEKFGEEFAFELYRWLLEQGRPYDLLTQDEVYSPFLTRFFQTHSYPDLAWIHHIACKRYAEASGDLLAVLDNVESEKGELKFRKVVGSVGKLVSMADVLRGGERDDTFQQIGQHLSLIDIQTSLRTYFLSLLPPRSSIRHLAKHLSPHITLLSNRPTLSHLFSDLASRLVSGQAIDVEGLVDLLGMKDNVGRENDAVEALNVLVHDRSLPKARSEVALISVWRRIYIRDDWAMIANTAGRSEQAQEERLKGTMVYHVMKALRSNPDFPPAAILPPYDTSIVPTPSEISARFSTLLAEDIDRLSADYEEEMRVLIGYVEENGLEARVEEIGRLVQEELGAAVNGTDEEIGEGDVDVEM